MGGAGRHPVVALTILAAITLLNVALAINIVSGNGRALAAMLSSRTLFLLAGAELVAVLATYVLSKHRDVVPPPESRDQTS